MPGKVHANKRLTDISLRFPAEFVSIRSRYFPRKSVDHLSDLIVRWNKANILRLDEMSPLGDDDLPPEMEVVLDADDAYLCRVFGVRAPAKEITRRNADPALDYDVERSISAKQRLDIRLEYLYVKQTLRDPTRMNVEVLTPDQRWDNPTAGNSLPVTKGRAVVAAIKYLNGGNPPNNVSLTTFTMNAILANEETKDYTKFNVVSPSQPIPDTATLEKLWNLPPGSVVISDATYNAAKADAPPQYKTFIGSSVIFGYTTPPGLRTYGLGVGFSFSGYSADPMAIIRVPQYDRGIIPGEDIRAFSIVDPHILMPDSGYVLEGCIDVTNPKYKGLVD
jgi:hypothetical protein